MQKKTKLPKKSKRFILYLIVRAFKKNLPTAKSREKIFI